METKINNNFVVIGKIYTQCSNCGKAFSVRLERDDIVYSVFAVRCEHCGSDVQLVASE